ncbi:LOW QUALITY PROTEIN: Reverse transcriptase [Phytophthora palmivora]|uniref:Reverse transcriptase n=1 Tax=Phytophthora palmivora TaxID=4796 RepID=A0A2P4XDD7_9STRA|nr:LOW QUALITY PROTEIN: Reverse transcriptase [Phytophthora palmivora]
MAVTRVVKPSGHASTSLQILPVSADCWKSMSLDFVFGLLAEEICNSGVRLLFKEDGSSRSDT